MRRAKPVEELTVQDLQEVPIWEYTGSGQPNHGSVRPRPRMQAIDLSVGRGTFIAATRFELADGSGAEGYSSPGGRWPSVDLIGYLQPAIITDEGPVPFWFALDEAPPDDFAAKYYRRLGKQRDETFPIRWRVAVQVPDGAAASGEIHAFSGLIWAKGEFVAFDRT